MLRKILLHGVLKVLFSGIFVTSTLTNIEFDLSLQSNGRREYDFLCKQNEAALQSNEYKYTLLEGGDAGINFNFDRYMNKVNCSYSNSILLHSDDEIGGKDSEIYIYVHNVTAKMSDVWICTILAFWNTNQMVPKTKYKDHTYAYTKCFARIHIRLMESPIRITVNNMILETPRTPLTVDDKDFYSEYNYEDGDHVEVACSKFPGKEGKLFMSYSYGDTLVENYENIAENYEHRVSFITNLTAGHENMILNCTLQQNHDQSVAIVKFIRRNSETDVTVKIYNAIIRPHDVKDDQIYIDYECKESVVKNNIMMIVIEGKYNTVTKIDFKRDSVSKKIIKVVDSNKLKTSLSLDLTKENDIKTIIKSIELSANIIYNNRNLNKVLHIKFVLIPEDKGVKENCLITMEGLNKSNVILEFNKDNRYKVIYYNFQNEDKLELRCRASNCGSSVKSLLLWNNINYYSSEASISLKEQNKGLKAYCFIKQKSKHFGNITVVFNQILPVVTPSLKPTTIDTPSPVIDTTSPITVATTSPITMVATSPITVVTTSKVSPSTSVATSAVLNPSSSTARSTLTPSPTTSTTLKSSTENTEDTLERSVDINPEPEVTSSETSHVEPTEDDGPKYKYIGIIAAVGVVTCIIIVCAVIVLFKMKQRRSKGQITSESNYMNLGHQPSISESTPQLASNYATPVDITEDTYSEPYKSESNLYALPLSKSQRKSQQPEQTYAVLDNTCLARPRNVLKKVDQNYAEIVRYSNLQKNESLYNNVENKTGYTNYGNAEYIEPTYCEANMKNNK